MVHKNNRVTSRSLKFTKERCIIHLHTWTTCAFWEQVDFLPFVVKITRFREAQWCLISHYTDLILGQNDWLSLSINCISWPLNPLWVLYREILFICLWSLYIILPLYRKWWLYNSAWSSMFFISMYFYILSSLSDTHCHTFPNEPQRARLFIYQKLYFSHQHVHWNWQYFFSRGSQELKTLIRDALLNDNCIKKEKGHLMLNWLFMLHQQC